MAEFTKGAMRAAKFLCDISTLSKVKIVAEIIDRETKCGEMLSALRIAVLFTAHNHMAGQDDNGDCPKCLCERVIREARGERT